VKQNEYVQGNGFVAQISRTDRAKSATIKVEGGVVVVVVPRTLTQGRIKKLLDDKKLWIQQKIALHPQTQVASGKQYVSGEAYSYLGRNYRLKVTGGELTPIKLVQGRLTMSAPKASQESKLIKYALTSWFRRRAELKLLANRRRRDKRLQSERLPISLGKLYPARTSRFQLEDNHGTESRGGLRSST
jgi:predicted metal-dependent hydrolase